MLERDTLFIVLWISDMGSWTGGSGSCGNMSAAGNSEGEFPGREEGGNRSAAGNREFPGGEEVRGLLLTVGGPLFALFATVG